MTAAMEAAPYFGAECDISDSALSPDIRVDSQAECLLPGLRLKSQAGWRKLVEFLIGQETGVAPLDYRTCAVDKDLVVYPTKLDSADEFLRFTLGQAGVGLIEPVYDLPNDSNY